MWMVSKAKVQCGKLPPLLCGVAPPAPCPRAPAGGFAFSSDSGPASLGSWDTRFGYS